MCASFLICFFFIFLTCAGAAGLLERAQSLITAVVKCLDCEKVSLLLKNLTGLWIFLN